jgi:hypothetical protein
MDFAYYDKVFARAFDVPVFTKEDLARVKILPSRTWKTSREQLFDVPKDGTQRADAYEAVYRAVENRWSSMKQRDPLAFETGPVSHSQVEFMLNEQQGACAICKTPFDFAMGDAENKNWKSLTIDRVDVIGDNPVLVKKPNGAYEWTRVPGYQGNACLLCFGCNSNKCKFHDKFEYSKVLLEDYPEDIPFYYRDLNLTYDNDSSNEWKTTLARFLYGRPVPNCELTGNGPCYKCGTPVSWNRIFVEEQWVRCCREHMYPQADALFRFCRMFYQWVKDNRQYDDKIVELVLHARPDPGQRDVLQTPREFATMLREFVNEDED